MEYVQDLRYSGLEVCSRKATNSRFSLMLACLIAFLISSRVGGRSRSFIITCYGIKSRAAGSTVEGLLNRFEKYSPYHTMMLSLSLSKVMLSGEQGVVLGYEDPYTALKELKNYLKLLLLENCWTLSAFFFHHSGLCCSCI